MGRRRTKDLDLPQGMRRIGHAFYLDSGGTPRIWTPLGSDKAKALSRWAELRGANTDERTVSALLDKVLAFTAKTCTENSMRSYRYYARTIRFYFGTAPVTQVKRGQIQEWHDAFPEMQKARHLALWFKGALTKAVEWGWITQNPAEFLRVNQKNKQERYVTDEEFLLLRGKLAPQYQIAVDLGYYLGLRVSDVVKLKFSDIKDGIIHIKQQKTGKYLPIKVTPLIEDVLANARALPRPVRGLYVICNQKGQPYHKNTVSHAIADAAVALGLEKTRFHDMRAKSASDEQGTATQRLGHGSSQTTRSYLRKIDPVLPIQRKVVAIKRA